MRFNQHSIGLRRKVRTFKNLIDNRRVFRVLENSSSASFPSTAISAQSGGGLSKCRKSFVWVEAEAFGGAKIFFAENRSSGDSCMAASTYLAEIGNYKFYTYLLYSVSMILSFYFKVYKCNMPRRRHISWHNFFIGPKVHCH